MKKIKKNSLILATTIGMLAIVPVQKAKASEIYRCKTGPNVQRWQVLQFDIEMSNGMAKAVTLSAAGFKTVTDSNPKVFSKDNQQIVYELNFYATGWNRHLITRADGNFQRMTYEYMAMDGGDGAGSAEKSRYPLTCQKL